MKTLNLKSGITIGSGAHSIYIKKVTRELIYVGVGAEYSVLRFIPVKLIEVLIKAINTNQISIDDISRNYRNDKNLPHLFDYLELDFDKFILGYDSTIKKICEHLLDTQNSEIYLPKSTAEASSLSKPFLLLAGISGTGKSRFVREQARLSDASLNNFELVSVRPDWHEPSDLLGYVTRLSGKAQFVSTDVLKFMVKAWKEISPSEADFKDGFIFDQNKKPFWLCLDEMNLAPVEQYFADYLSVLETRKIEEGDYFCDPLVKPSVFAEVLAHQDEDSKEDAQKALAFSLGLDFEADKELFNSILKYGIPLPFNLIVAGTVNMDETTHGFSRKVIDRALTLDFGEFFPNDFDRYGKEDIQPIGLTYPQETHIYSFENDDALKETKEFLKKVNSVLEGTMFELAYRALNEALLMVDSFAPVGRKKLCAIWDDFLMMKVLPRIEGDEDKLSVVNSTGSEASNVLTKLQQVLSPEFNEVEVDDIEGSSSAMLSPIWNENRPDLLRDGVENIECRSKKKLAQMQRKLERGFTTFWP